MPAGTRGWRVRGSAVRGRTASVACMAWHGAWAGLGSQLMKPRRSERTERGQETIKCTGWCALAPCPLFVCDVGEERACTRRV